MSPSRPGARMTGNALLAATGSAITAPPTRDLVPSALLRPHWQALTQIRDAVPAWLEALWCEGSDGPALSRPSGEKARLAFVDRIDEEALCGAAEAAEAVLRAPLTKADALRIGAAVVAIRPRLGDVWVDGLIQRLQLDPPRPSAAGLALGAARVATEATFDLTQAMVIEAAREAERRAWRHVQIARAAELLHQELTDWAIDRGLITYGGADDAF